MIETQLKLVVMSALFLVLWLMFFTIHRSYHIARTRQNLFGVRARLFNAALEGKISFDDSAYQLVRQAINGMIRFTHNLSFLRWFSIVMFNRYARNELSGRFNSRLEEALDNLTNDQKQLLLRALADSHLLVMRHLMSVSIFWIIFKPLSILLKISNLTKSARHWAMKGPKRTEQWRRFDAEVTYNSSCEDEESDCGLLLAA